MKKPQTNYAFIDANNLHLGMQGVGWALSYPRFRHYLRVQHGVGRAYMFLGRLATHRALHERLRRDGFELILKEVSYDPSGKPKGNVDAELVLHAAAIDYAKYAQAVIVTSDGDFASLVDFLRDRGKLRAVLSPSRTKASALLKRAARERFDTLAPLRATLEHKK